MVAESISATLMDSRECMAHTKGRVTDGSSA